MSPSPAPRRRLGGRSGCGKRFPAEGRGRGKTVEALKERWAAGSALETPQAIHGISMPEQVDRDETARGVLGSLCELYFSKFTQYFQRPSSLTLLGKFLYG